MRKNSFAYFLLCLTLPYTTAYGEAIPLGVANVEGGDFYIGSVFGKQDYAAHTNTHLNSFAIMRTEVTYHQYHVLQAWAETQGYQLSGGCNGALFEDCLPPETDDGDHPVTNVSWWDAIIFANVLSDQQHLPAYYITADGLPLKKAPDDGTNTQVFKNTQTSGYRLPALTEWMVAARGGLKGVAEGTYGNHYAGSDRPDDVANFPNQDTQTFRTLPVASRQANALGLYDMSGNVSEWLDDEHSLEGGEGMHYFCGGSYLERAGSLASCDMHTPGFAMPDIGFRLVRTLGEK